MERSSLTLMIFFAHPAGTMSGPERKEARHCGEGDPLGPFPAQSRPRADLKLQVC